MDLMSSQYKCDVTIYGSFPIIITRPMENPFQTWPFSLHPSINIYVYKKNCHANFKRKMDLRADQKFGPKAEKSATVYKMV